MMIKNLSTEHTLCEDEGVCRVNSQDGQDHLRMILIMPCRSEETFDTEVNVTWMGLNPPLSFESKKERKANGRLY